MTPAPKKASIWGPELWLLFLIPAVLISAIVITVMIASDAAFTPEENLQTDRFARTLEDDS